MRPRDTLEGRSRIGGMIDRVGSISLPRKLHIQIIYYLSRIIYFTQLPVLDSFLNIPLAHTFFRNHAPFKNSSFSDIAHIFIYINRASFLLQHAFVAQLARAPVSYCLNKSKICRYLEVMSSSLIESKSLSLFLRSLL